VGGRFEEVGCGEVSVGRRDEKDEEEWESGAEGHLVSKGR